MAPPADGPGAEGTTPAAPSLQNVVARIDRISTLPAVALRVIQVASDPESGAEDLRRAMEADPTLCVRVLRCVNSASFGLRTSIDDLGRAVAYLGFNQIRDLAVTATVSDLFSRPRQAGRYERAGLWRHLVAVAVAARMVAGAAQVTRSDLAFLAGLLHDLGILLFDQHRPDDFHRVMGALDGKRTLVEVERDLVGWDHTQLGAAVAEQWRLPPLVVRAARWHHDPDHCDDAGAAPIVHTVAVANGMCARKEITSVGWNLLGLATTSLDALGLSEADFQDLVDRLDGELDANGYLFDLQAG